MPRSIDYMHVVISSEYSTDLANDQQVHRRGCQIEAISRPFKKMIELRLQPRGFLRKKIFAPAARLGQVWHICIEIPRR